MGTAHKIGRPAQFIGVRACDLRIRFTRLGQSRALFARWRPNLKRWECQLSGYGLHTQRWFARSQFVVESTLRLRQSTSTDNGWRWLKRETGQWDGRPDLDSPVDYYQATMYERIQRLAA